jgi:membrane-associated phospholipid phosphatase
MTPPDRSLPRRIVVLFLAASLTAASGAATAQDAGVRDGPEFEPQAVFTGTAPYLRSPAATPDTVVRVPGDRTLLRRGDLVPASAVLAALAVAVSSPGLERSVRTSAYHDGSGPDHLFYRAGDVAGDAWVDLGASGVTWLAGTLAGSDAAARAGRRALEATVASTAVVAVLKMGFGRARPSLSSDPRNFDPGTFDRERFSFPSGHTAHAFAIAAGLDHVLDGPWVPWIAYPLATGVGASRVVGRRHWVTDVVAGAGVGILTARVLDRLYGGTGSGDAGHVRPRVGVGPDGTPTLGLSVALGN